MNAAADAGFFEERFEPGLARSIALAVAVHVFLALVLLFGVRWQNRPPEAVSVELWILPPAPVIEPLPKPMAEPAPAPKPEPVIAKPDIALKEPPKPKPVPELKPKPEPPKAATKLRDDPVRRRMQEELAREQTALLLDRERAKLRQDASAARDLRGIADWVNKVRAKIRGNIVLPPDLRGNPEAVFDVVQLPTGEVLSVKLRKSSGTPALDAAIERAILKSSPLPKPDRPELFERSFELKYRPQD